MGEGTEIDPAHTGDCHGVDSGRVTAAGNMAYHAMNVEDGAAEEEISKSKMMFVESTATMETVIFDDDSVSYKKLEDGAAVFDDPEIKPMMTSNGDVDKAAQVKTRNVSVSSANYTRLYKRRWLMLGLFCMLSMSNAFQWIQYSVIGNVLVDYYNVEYIAVDWLSMIYMLVYIPLIFPVTWLLERAGLKVVGILGASLNCAGSWFRYAGAVPHLFPLAFAGQTLCAIGQVFILGMPAHVAATWFGAKEVSTACAIGVFGNQLGVALGFVLPPLLVPPDGDVKKNMHNMFVGTAAITSALLILIIAIYQDKPPMPPSKAKYDSQKSTEGRSYKESIISLFKNVPFVLLLITYGVNVGSFYAISTLLNQVILSEFPGYEVMVGVIGLTLVLTGMVGSVVTGFWLDRTRSYRGTTVTVYVLSLVGMICFTFTLKLGEIWVVFGITALLGFFMTGYLPLGFEFAAELTFPEPEGTSSGLLNASAQTFGIIFTLVMGVLVNEINSLSGNLFLCVALLVGTIVTAFIKSDLRRQTAEKQEFEEVEEESDNKESSAFRPNRISSVRFEGMDDEDDTVVTKDRD
ncbi:feline leukemia virus subgroup C receptor-related protein 2-like [Lytechinus variegatus]|uniref:feline leukemia virus subgroup C receptor-related protein 2-like n=1 Tax=Lytechinus variegatus TaxID=7654 RepID=UPI001BB16CF6|nr:feline leukemia virus subgroup C receptor-related protein 2-like [Lytechinus variegatus]